MSESDRVQRWRQRQREAGKEPLTIWLTAEEKGRLEDMAQTRRCSPSDLVQQALAAWHGDPSLVTATVPATEQLRALMQHELAHSPIVTATVTDTVTATLQQTLPGLVRAILDEHQAESALSPAVTATVTDTVTDTKPSLVTVPVPAPAQQCVADTVTDTVTDTATAPPAKGKAPSRRPTVTDTITVTDSALEPFDTAKYVLGKLCPRGHAWGNTGQSLLRRTNRHCGACDREKFQERGKAQRQQKRQEEERV